MKLLIKLEYLALFCLGLYLFSRSGFAWWWFPAWLLAPDISMLGYLAGTRVGAFTYNLFHHIGTAIVVYLAGMHLQQDVITLTGIILFSHSAMDRLFGYGLKYQDSFQHTHLGWIGQGKQVVKDDEGHVF